MEEKELDRLIAGMTWKEKVRQLTQINASFIREDKEAAITGKCGSLDLEWEDVCGIGTVLNFNGAAAAAAIHETHGQNSDIPLILMQDVIHGYRTMYPLNIAMGGTFEPELVEACAKMSAVEARLNGVHVTFAPMVDLVRDARWGRVMESTGEDPYLNGIMGRAFIRGYHQGGLAVCVKHFAAYGACEAGKDYNTTDMSEHTLREYYLRGYEECMKEQPEMVMSSFNALNGIPVNGHTDLLVDLLRKEWGFDGVLISDYNGIGEMIPHGYAASLKECAAIAANSEIDIEMMSSAYIHHLPDLVSEGRVSGETVDRMLRRVLMLKNKLALFENPKGGLDGKQAEEICLSEEYRALARTAAEKTCVLLKNNGLLPLKREQKVALIGPYADEQSILGNWKCLGKIEEAVSIKMGIETLLGRTVPVAQGCDAGLLSTDRSGIPEAVNLSCTCDAVIVCVGEPAKDAGEGASRSDLTLPDVQLELIRALAGTGKKLVLVVFGGRPQVLTEAEPYADAILYAWQPGTEGGSAVANLLYGVAQPSAKLTMSFPRTTGQCPVYYNHFSTGRPKEPDTMENNAFVSGYRDTLNAPLYPFGYGLTYTQFELSGFRLSSGTLKRGESVTASAVLKNTGCRSGEEVVQLYIRDKFASVVRPVKELKGFQKIALAPGEQAAVSFTIDEALLKFWSSRGIYEAETGAFDIMLGLNSRDVTVVQLELLDS